MNRILNSSSRASASLDVDIDVIDTDDEGDGDDDLNIGRGTLAVRDGRISPPIRMSIALGRYLGLDIYLHRFG